ncbi:DUF7563 family protein [Natrialbaceae archaeon AArc-T1-2]|uniref:DUF7563 family protein n=1 Tax=Natrialbaceae archaeon AArc-T1-2 TaxID=3053904 RepID=UPI00255AFB92|nr:hypothetical protein [Natrialbaceae archaeon AArc-T1-2]WIV68444.1 hypothetical protein QQ977_06900 [Natrialbaceae archaeon AArc-T1-2]
MQRWQPTSRANRCLTCGSHVTPEFRRGFGDADDRAQRCTECDNYGRLANGSAAGLDVGSVDPLDSPDRFGVPFDELNPAVRSLCQTVATDGGGVER